MMQNDSFLRKVIYVVVIAVLIIPLSFVARPSAIDSKGQRIPGGKLAQLRDEQKLSQTQLGDIDPASETMKLATLGLRPFAVAWLWTQVDEYKKKENWEQLSAALNQIIKIQPNFIKVWEFQAHNLSYNISREFDDFEDRYAWVKQGIVLLIKGIGYNRNDHRIIDNLGQFFGLKVGRADESASFRRMLRNDKDFHVDLEKEISLDATRSHGGPDNWLVAYEWYQRSLDMVDRQNVPLRGNGPLIFYMNCPKQLRNFAMDLEKEFRPEEEAQIAWEKAKVAWLEYGSRPILHTSGFPVKVGGMDEQNAIFYEKQAKLDTLVPGVRAQLRAEREATLLPEEKAAMAIPYDERQIVEHEWANTGYGKVQVTDLEVAQMAPPEVKDEVDVLIAEIAFIARRMSALEGYRDTSNFSYWELRCRVESEDMGLAARRAHYDAEELLKKAIIVGSEKIDPETGEKSFSPGATDKFVEAYHKWNDVFQKYPAIAEEMFEDELRESMQEYEKIVRDVDQWPLDFPLQWLLDKRAKKGFAEVDALPNYLTLKARKDEQEALKAATSGANSTETPSPDANNNSPEPSPQATPPGESTTTESPESKTETPAVRPPLPDIPG
jgi:tetratricopeptide (TPR) repeat protein